MHASQSNCEVETVLLFLIFEIIGWFGAVCVSDEACNGVVHRLWMLYWLGVSSCREFLRKYVVLCYTVVDLACSDELVFKKVLRVLIN
jgi:hypothetical protein